VPSSGRPVFRGDRLQGRYLMVAVDASGIGKYRTDPTGTLLGRRYKDGIKAYFRYVLEAKLVTSSGKCLSLATEWVENGAGEAFDKQDCEREAFKRLAAKLKAYFPRERLSESLPTAYTQMSRSSTYAWPIIGAGLRRLKKVTCPRSRTSWKACRRLVSAPWTTITGTPASVTSFSVIAGPVTPGTVSSLSPGSRVRSSPYRKALRP